MNKPQYGPSEIAEPLLAWFDRHGRHDLPWQHPRTPYRVWIGEIMLQQTQVATVIGYFQRFMARFPTVEALAEAKSDDVMAHWAGLGYYARARNLHKAAKQIVAEHGGRFPPDVDSLMALPGIGRSTAGAVVAQAFGIRAPILDGNAKRVLARVAGMTTTPGTAAHDKALWALAEQYTPHERITDYTQAIMDLGATCCTRRNPDCHACPLACRCMAFQQGRQTEIPRPRKKRARPQRWTKVLLVRDNANRLLLVKRPPTGIWGGLWSLPEIALEADVRSACRERLGMEVIPGREKSPLIHDFTHFRLVIHPQEVKFVDTIRIMEQSHEWYMCAELPGLPAPIARIVQTAQLDLDL